MKWPGVDNRVFEDTSNSLAFIVGIDIPTMLTLLIH